MLRAEACHQKAPFTVSVDATLGISTGISAADRALADPADASHWANPEVSVPRHDRAVSQGEQAPVKATHSGQLAAQLH
jgi:3,4-dihydroxy-2-butanone 4-phosphate synthase